MENTLFINKFGVYTASQMDEAIVTAVADVVAFQNITGEPVSYQLEVLDGKIEAVAQMIDDDNEAIAAMEAAITVRKQHIEDAERVRGNLQRVHGTVSKATANMSNYQIEAVKA